MFHLLNFRAGNSKKVPHTLLSSVKFQVWYGTVQKLEFDVIVMGLFMFASICLVVLSNRLLSFSMVRVPYHTPRYCRRVVKNYVGSWSSTPTILQRLTHFCNTPEVAGY